MQKNVPKYTPDWVETVTWWAETSKRDVRYALVQRPAHAAVVRQPARHRVPPGAGDGGASRPHHPPRARPRSARGLRLRARRRGRAPRAPGARRRRPRRRAEDERRQGRAHLRARRRGSAAGGLGRRGARRSRSATAALDPSIATTAFIKDDREGKVFVDSTRVGGATVVAAYSPRVRPGVPVSFPLAWDQLDDVHAVGLHHPHRARRARRPRSVGRAHAGTAAPRRRPDRRRATRSRWRACRRCTRASDGNGRGGVTEAVRGPPEPQYRSRMPRTVPDELTEPVVRALKGSIDIGDGGTDEQRAVYAPSPSASSVGATSTSKRSSRSSRMQPPRSITDPDAPPACAR